MDEATATSVKHETATKRLYVVKPGEAVQQTTPRLIRATSQASALRHATKGLYDVAAATTEDVANLMADGVKVEDAG